MFYYNEEVCIGIGFNGHNDGANADKNDDDFQGDDDTVMMITRTKMRTMMANTITTMTMMTTMTTMTMMTMMMMTMFDLFSRPQLRPSSISPPLLCLTAQDWRPDRYHTYKCL